MAGQHEAGFDADSTSDEDKNYIDTATPNKVSPTPFRLHCYLFGACMVVLLPWAICLCISMKDNTMTEIVSKRRLEGIPSSGKYFERPFAFGSLISDVNVSWPNLHFKPRM